MTVGLDGGGAGGGAKMFRGVWGRMISLMVVVLGLRREELDDRGVVEGCCGVEGGNALDDDDVGWIVVVGAAWILIASVLRLRISRTPVQVTRAQSYATTRRPMVGRSLVVNHRPASLLRARIASAASIKVRSEILVLSISTLAS